MDRRKFIGGILGVGAVARTDRWLPSKGAVSIEVTPPTRKVIVRGYNQDGEEFKEVTELHGKVDVGDLGFERNGGGNVKG